MASAAHDLVHIRWRSAVRVGRGSGTLRADWSTGKDAGPCSTHALRSTVPLPRSQQRTSWLTGGAELPDVAGGWGVNLSIHEGFLLKCIMRRLFTKVLRGANISDLFMLGKSANGHVSRG